MHADHGDSMCDAYGDRPTVTLGDSTVTACSPLCGRPSLPGQIHAPSFPNNKNTIKLWLWYIGCQDYDSTIEFLNCKVNFWFEFSHNYNWLTHKFGLKDLTVH